MSAEPATVSPQEVEPAERVALVTGASRGIGRAIALALADEGYHVLANWARSGDAAASLQDEIQAREGRCTLVRANVGSPAGIERLAESVRGTGRLDALVHNAALGSFKPILDVRRNQWMMSMSVNVHALLEMTRELRDALAWSRGCVVSLSSQGASRVIPNYGAIGVSKAALESLTRYLAVELGPFGVRVNTICAGWIDTDAILTLPGVDKIREVVRSRTPLGRLGEPDDIADAVRLLLRPEARWITGQVVVADGGSGIT